jgi:hypothetical protein
MKVWTYLLALLVTGVTVAGCEPQDVGNANFKPPTQEEIEADIKRIEADPNMPPQAKAMAINQLRQNGSGQKSMDSGKK